MLTISPSDLAPITKKLEDYDVTVKVKRATLADDGRRYTMLFKEADTAVMSDIALVEMWLTLQEADIAIGDQPVFKENMSFADFSEAATHVWNYDPSLFWAIHAVVREANPRWEPSDLEGN